MNYYPHHIGDFNSATRHLTRVERSIYRDLIDLYYDTEQPLMVDRDKLCRLVLARSDEERTAVEQVLNEFFTESEHGWAHARCDSEIAKYHGNKEAKSAAGKASAAKRASKTLRQPNELTTADQQPSNDSSTGVQQPLNQCATNQNHNQEPNSSDLDRSGVEPPRFTHSEPQGPAKPPTPADVIFGRGVPLLAASGLTDKQARSMLGLMRKEHGDGAVVDAIQAAVDEQAIEPVGFMQRTLKTSRKKPFGPPARFDPLAHINRNRTRPSPGGYDDGIIDA